MAISPFIKPVGIIAAILGIIQGAVWFILSLITILISSGAWTPDVSANSNTYGQLLSFWILNGYVNGKVSLGASLGIKLFIRPQEFYGWAILYIIISIAWMAFSSLLLNVILQEKMQKLRNVLLGWGIWTIFPCVVDLLLASLLASDYNELVGAVNAISIANACTETYKILACGVLLVLAAKGFVLWIINVTFIIIIIKFSLSLPRKMDEVGFHSSVAQFIGRPMLSSGNKDDTDLAQSTSFGTFHGLPRLQPVQSVNEKLRIERSSFRSEKANDNTDLAQRTSFGTFHGLPRLEPVQNVNEKMRKIERSSFRSGTATGFPTEVINPYNFGNTSPSLTLRSLRKF